ncbi:TPA: hypothetical protein VB850_002188 [Streptococcus suis]|nr:hypothetical protein [Streptococcus suis]
MKIAIIAANGQAGQTIAKEAVERGHQATAVNWTYISPAADFDAEGQKAGAYTLAGEVFQVNAQGESYISYADYAVALVDIAEKGGYQQERISVFAS